MTVSIFLAPLAPPLPWLHVPQGQATDIAIQAEEIMKLRKQLYSIYAKHTKQSLQVIGECPAPRPSLAPFTLPSTPVPARPCTEPGLPTAALLTMGLLESSPVAKPLF